MKNSTWRSVDAKKTYQMAQACHLVGAQCPKGLTSAPLMYPLTAKGLYSITFTQGTHKCLALYWSDSLPINIPSTCLLCQGRHVGMNSKKLVIPIHFIS